MAVTKEHLDISRQALLQSQRAALLYSGVDYIFSANEFAQQTRRPVEGIAGLEPGLAPSFIQHRSRIVESWVGAGKEGLALQAVAIVLQLEPVSKARSNDLRPGRGTQRLRAAESL